MVNHIEIFKIVKSATLAGYKQHRLAAVTVDFKLHIPVQVAAPVLEITNFHLFFSL
jgi:hypothetical protein